MHEHKTTFWGIRFGDGQIEGGWTSREDVEAQIASDREMIANGTWDADDYEPMSIVSRTQVTRTSNWKSA